MSFFEIPIPESALEYKMPKGMKHIEIDCRKWAYREHEDVENAGGPYDTQDEAITAAIESLEGDYDIGWREVLIGRCKFIDPSDVIVQTLDLEDVIERMDEYAYDNCFPYDDSFFDINDRGVDHGAKIALREALKCWATRHLECGVWMIEDEEKVKVYIPDNDKEGDCPICKCYGKVLEEFNDENGDFLKCEYVECKTCKGKGYLPNADVAKLQLEIWRLKHEEAKAQNQASKEEK